MVKDSMSNPVVSCCLSRQLLVFVIMWQNLVQYVQKFASIEAIPICVWSAEGDQIVYAQIQAKN